MDLIWTEDALADLERLHAFLASVNLVAASRVVRNLAIAPERLLEQPRLGTRLTRLDPREVRRIITHGYKVRYEVTEASIVILRLGTVASGDGW